MSGATSVVTIKPAEQPACEVCPIHSTPDLACMACAIVAQVGAAELGKGAGQRFAAKRLKMQAPMRRLDIAQCAGRSHMSAWDHGKVKGAADVGSYCQAFIDAVFAVLEPAKLVTL